MKLTIYRT